MFKIYIAEDDKNIAEEMRKELSKWGFAVKVAQNFDGIMDEFAEFEPHLVLLDIVLPRFDGYYFLGEIRKRSDLPVIMISSRDGEQDIVGGIRQGADDYLVKPFSLAVLIAKVNGALRRAYEMKMSSMQLVWMDLSYDPGDGKITADGKTLDLTKNEMKIMSLLIKAAGDIVTREELMLALWDTESYVDDNTLTVNMTRLKKRLEETFGGQRIKTKKGVGNYLE